MTFEKNTAAGAARQWLEIVVSRVLPSILPWLFIRKSWNFSSVRAAVVGRGEHNQILIKGVARHPELPGRIRFEWTPNITEVPGEKRTVSERLGSGSVQYLSPLTSAVLTEFKFMLEESKDNELWLRPVSRQGEEPSSVRYSLRRGKMRAPLSETRR